MPTRGVEFAKVSYTPEGGLLVLREVSVSLPAGSVTALLGRSGSGKTTLLRLVNALVRPTSGEVMVDGRPVGAMQAPEELVSLRRGIGYAIQETGLFPHMTIERNTALGLELEGRPQGEREQRSREILEQVGLDFDRIRTRLPWQLSGGQRQRVGLARALALDPAVLLMDEPFGALDPLTRAEMHAMLKSLLVQKPRTVLMVTHDLNEALFLADRILILAEGEIVADLAPAEVMRSENPHVKDYVSAVNQMMWQ
ncbi:ATP-binding cassette domain-containing protein [Edaphobacter sp. 12200R-103]|uniref:ATP-binding cassette domain-containing protein n=1 Tax=Edaphobacter sp. 12200R-103 TaxID=2703788 RepID=UPI00138C3972|nr:ATP-binding cassette domain-containing protein [Edaphobacter sp. 12200R-103]QHS50565.1 ATP-binding cassette domain-containing protein [Edaphobacter sp. 12200R-103]